MYDIKGKVQQNELNRLKKEFGSADEDKNDMGNLVFVDSDEEIEEEQQVNAQPFNHSIYTLPEYNDEKIQLEDL
jgi:hypothetical protein